MQVVILAAGLGTRLHPLTFSLPKPILPLGDKSILKHTIFELPREIKEIILIIGFGGEKIKKEIGEKILGRKVIYVFQEKQLGTGDAILKAKPFLKEKFLVLNGDDIYQKEDLKNLLKKFPSILVAKVKNPENFGQLVIKDGKIKEIVEKPQKIVSYFVNTGAYFLPKKILNFKIEKSERGEYEIISFLQNFLQKESLFAAFAKNWIPVSYPWDLLSVNEIFLEKIKRKIQGKISSKAKIKGKVIVEKGSIILENVVIEGPVIIGKNCRIGPNSYIRGKTIIQDNCHVGAHVEIKNSIIFFGTKIPHLNYVGDSLIGPNSNLGAGTIIANLRHDEKNVLSKVKGKIVDTGRKKFGAVLGEGVKTGIGTLIYPGRKIWPQKTTLPGEIVKEDII